MAYKSIGSSSKSQFNFFVPQGQHGVRSLPDTSTHDREWDSTLRCSNLESRGLSLAVCSMYSGHIT